MKRTLKWLMLLVLGAAVVWALTAWPLINSVETGKTPEYPDLKVLELSQGPRAVAAAAERAIARLPRWSLTGSGWGPRGGAIQAVASTRVLRFKDDVAIQIRRAGGKTRVSVKSSSRIGKWDFGQNARNVRELLSALEQELAR